MDAKRLFWVCFVYIRLRRAKQTQNKPKTNQGLHGFYERLPRVLPAFFKSRCNPHNNIYIRRRRGLLANQARAGGGIRITKLIFLTLSYVGEALKA